jgi:hypothetical protein
MPDFKGETTFFSLPANSPHYAGVGRVASEWARLEWDIDRTSWVLAGVKEEQGACMTAQIGSIQLRLRTLIALAQLDNQPTKNISALNKFATDCNPIAIKRNRAIHDAWWLGSTTKKPAQLRLTADKKLDYRFREAPEGELEAIKEEIKALAARFHEIQTAMFIARRRYVSFSTSPGTSEK